MLCRQNVLRQWFLCYQNNGSDSSCPGLPSMGRCSPQWWLRILHQGSRYGILTERLHEFPLEFKIWDDIRRTRLYPEENGVQSGKLKWVALQSATIQNKPDGKVKTGAIPEFALLWPIPLDEIQANPSLQGHQNPGWN